MNVETSVESLITKIDDLLKGIPGSGGLGGTSAAGAAAGTTAALNGLTNTLQSGAIIAGNALSHLATGTLTLANVFELSAETLKLFPIIGGFAGEALKVFSKDALEANQNMRENLKFGDTRIDLLEFRRQVIATGLSSAEYNDIIKNNSNSLRRMGGTYEDSINTFMSSLEEMKMDQFGQGLLRLGVGEAEFAKTLEYVTFNTNKFSEAGGKASTTATSTALHLSDVLYDLAGLYGVQKDKLLEETKAISDSIKGRLAESLMSGEQLKAYKEQQLIFAAASPVLADFNRILRTGVMDAKDQALVAAIPAEIQNQMAANKRLYDEAARTQNPDERAAKLKEADAAAIRINQRMSEMVNDPKFLGMVAALASSGPAGQNIDKLTTDLQSKYFGPLTEEQRKQTQAYAEATKQKITDDVSLRILYNEMVKNQRITKPDERPVGEQASIAINNAKQALDKVNLTVTEELNRYLANSTAIKTGLSEMNTNLTKWNESMITAEQRSKILPTIMGQLNTFVDDLIEKAKKAAAVPSTAINPNTQPTPQSDADKQAREAEERRRYPERFNPDGTRTRDLGTTGMIGLNVEPEDIVTSVERGERVLNPKETDYVNSLPMIFRSLSDQIGNLASTGAAFGKNMNPATQGIPIEAVVNAIKELPIQRQVDTTPITSDKNDIVTAISNINPVDQLQTLFAKTNETFASITNTNATSVETRIGSFVQAFKQVTDTLQTDKKEKDSSPKVDATSAAPEANAQDNLSAGINQLNTMMATLVQHFEVVADNSTKQVRGLNNLSQNRMS